MHYHSDKGKVVWALAVHSPGEDLGVMYAAAQTFQTADQFNSLPAYGVDLQSTLIASQYYPFGLC